MITIKKKINIPFQRVVTNVKYVKLMKMNELESLIMILISSSTELGFQGETLKESIAIKFGNKEWTKEIIILSIKSLIKHNTFNKEVEPLGLLNTSIRRVKLLVKDNIIKNVLKGIFLMNSNEVRKQSISKIDSIIPGTKYNNNTPTVFDDSWKVKGFNDQQKLTHAIETARENKGKNEDIEFCEVDKGDTNIVYVDMEIEFKVEGKKIIPSNNLSNIVFTEIKNGNLNIDIFSKMMDSSINGLPITEKSGDTYKANNKFSIINDQYFDLKQSEPFLLLNGGTEYIISDVKQNFIVNEIYEKKIKIEKLIDLIIKNEEYFILSETSLDIKESIKNYVLENYQNKNFNKIISILINDFNENEILYKHSEIVKAIKDQDFIRGIINKMDKNYILNNLDILNEFITPELKSLYELIYIKINKNYDEETTIFPKWEKEIEFKNFVNKIKDIKIEIELIKTKEEAIEVMKLVDDSSFIPIKSNLINILKSKIRKKIN